MNFLTLTTLFLLIAQLAVAQKQDSAVVYFDHDAYQAFQQNPLTTLIENSEKVAVQSITGFTDHLGSDAYNYVLAERRAKSVANFLKKNGVRISEETITIKGELPANGAEGGIAKHRKVVVIFSASQTAQKVEEESDVLKMDPSGSQNLVLDGVQFMGGRHYPLPSSQTALSKLVNTLVKYPDVNIEIQGYICCEYEKFDGLDFDTQTLNLSENRAKFIYDYLIEKGIDQQRLSYKGYGSSKPKVYPEITEADRMVNRRVEIKILK